MVRLARVVVEGVPPHVTQGGNRRQLRCGAHGPAARRRRLHGQAGRESRPDPCETEAGPKAAHDRRGSGGIVLVLRWADREIHKVFPDTA